MTVWMILYSYYGDKTRVDKPHYTKESALSSAKAANIQVYSIKEVTLTEGEFDVCVYHYNRLSE